MMRSFRRVLIVGMLHATGWAAGAQPTPEVVSIRRCAECNVELKPVVTLGDANGPGALESDVNQVRRDSRGRYFVFNGGPSIWVFDPRGAFVTRLGRDGDGPGEFREVSGVLPARGDSIIVFDWVHRRMTVFSPDLRFVRTAPTGVPGGLQSAVVGDHLLINAMVRTPGRIGHPLHFLDYDGSILLSFGSQDGLYRPDLRDALELRQVTSHANGVWSAWVSQYQLEEWDTAGRLRRILRRDVPWFPTWWRPGRTGESPPAPTTTGIQISGDTLWVLVLVPAPAWQSAVVARPGRHVSVSDYNVYQHTVIEALDVGTAEVLASTRVPRHFTGFVGPRLVAGVGIDPVGNPVIPVWELVISSTNHRGGLTR